MRPQPLIAVRDVEASSRWAPVPAESMIRSPVPRRKPSSTMSVLPAMFTVRALPSTTVPNPAMPLTVSE